MFQKECVLITGANGGMGQAAATAFYREGASLVLCDLDTEGLTVFAKQQSFDANRCICLSCDVTKEAAVKQTIKTAVQTFGGVDHLVNCAGIDGRMAYIADHNARECQGHLFLYEISNQRHAEAQTGDNR